MNIDALAEEIKNCKRCGLWKTRKNPVPGKGGFRKKIMLVGEAPGYWEDEKGEPFVGRAGKLLDELLKKGGLSRDDVFITNVLKCRPPNNRDPKPEEIEACKVWLEKQLEILRPKIIITLGRFSWKWFCQRFGLKYIPLSQVHGMVFRVNDIVLIPMYHPALGLYNPQKKEEMMKDWEKVRDII